MKRSYLGNNQRNYSSGAAAEIGRLEMQVIQMDLDIHTCRKELNYLDTLSEQSFRRRKKEQLKREIEQYESVKYQLLEMLLRKRAGVVHHA